MRLNFKSPHERMVELDEQGDAYVVGVKLTSGVVFADRSVMFHSESWINIETEQDEDGVSDFWVNMSHVAHLKITLG